MTSPPPSDEWPSQPHLPDDALTNGQVFAGYQIIGLLGTGGMGRVYLAQHPRLPRRDALKLLPRDWSSDADYRARFNREADLASTLWHPNIVGVHDRGEADGQLWISMDYVDGLDAARLVAERHPTGMPAEEVAQIVIAVGRALDSAHKRGLLHRDVKPANIMITHLDDDGEQRILLTDFGLAHDVNDDRGFTATEMTLGTVAYCAPEQLLGEDVDGRADQYALAATAYALLTGRPVFPDSDPSVVVSHQIDTTPTALAQTRPELASLDPVLAVALAKRPEDRFARCSDFARALSEQIAATVVPSPRADPYGHVDPAGQRPSDHLPPPEQVSIEDRFTEPLTVDPRVVAPKPKQFRLWPVVAGVAGVVVVGLAAWLLWPSSGGPDSSGADAAQPTPTTAKAAGGPARGLSVQCVHTRGRASGSTREGELRQERRCRRPAVGDLYVARGQGGAEFGVRRRGTRHPSRELPREHSVTGAVAPQCNAATGQRHTRMRFQGRRPDVGLDGRRRPTTQLRRRRR
jgi:serine/threonine protein kinase